jgi:hypothetical protein
MLGNVSAARQTFERWMEWEPDDNGWNAYIKFEMRQQEPTRARQVFERYVACHPTQRAYLKFAKWEEKQLQVGGCVRAKQEEKEMHAVVRLSVATDAPPTPFHLTRIGQFIYHQPPQPTHHPTIHPNTNTNQRVCLPTQVPNARAVYERAMEELPESERTEKVINHAINIHHIIPSHTHIHPRSPHHHTNPPNTKPEPTHTYTHIPKNHKPHAIHHHHHHT